MKDRFVIQVEGVKRDFFNRIFHTRSNLMSVSLPVTSSVLNMNAQLTSYVKCLSPCSFFSA